MRPLVVLVVAALVLTGGSVVAEAQSVRRVVSTP
jgi:hypothetical protein